MVTTGQQFTLKVVRVMMGAIWVETCSVRVIGRETNAFVV
jgi:hypothetical protein